MAKGTKDDPWKLKTPSNTSDIVLWRDPDATPPALFCIASGTELRYHLRIIDDMHAMLKKHGDWMELGNADEQKPAKDGTVEAWARSPDNPVGGWYGLKKGLRGRVGNYVTPVLEALGLVELEHNRQGQPRPGEVAPNFDHERPAIHSGGLGGCIASDSFSGSSACSRSSSPRCSSTTDRGGRRRRLGAETQLIAHRGVHQTFHRENLEGDTCTAERIYPPEHDYLENTLRSMEAAFAAGADIVELDVHPTTDGHFAVIHDWTVDCRTEGTGETRSHDLAYLKTLDVGYGYTADGGETYPFRGKGVGLMPSFDEVMAAFPDKKFLVNYKSNEEREGDMLAAMVAEHPEWRAAIWGAYGGDPPTYRAAGADRRTRRLVAPRPHRLPDAVPRARLDRLSSRKPAATPRSWCRSTSPACSGAGPTSSSSACGTTAAR